MFPAPLGQYRCPARLCPQGPAWAHQARQVLAVTLLHNAEELLTVRAALSRPPLAPLLDRWGVSPQRAWSAFRTLNWAVSVAATAAVTVGVRRGRPAVPGVVAATMLVNVLVPHVPAAVRARGYAPGLVTAVTLVLPATGRYLLQSHRQGLLSQRELRRCLQAGLGLVVLGVPVGLIAADRLAGPCGNRSVSRYGGGQRD
jgi:hypothetical protein